MTSCKVSVLLAIAIAVVFTMRIHAQSGAALIDTSKISDAKAKAAVEKIGELQAKIKELKVDEMTDCQIMGPNDKRTTVTITTKSTIMERRPDLFLKSDRWTSGPFAGNINAILMDGKNIWMMSKTGQAMLDHFAQNMAKNKRPQAEIDKFIEQMKGLKVSRYDVERLKAAGVFERASAEFRVWLSPLMFVDPVSMTLDQDTATAWVLTANSNSGRAFPMTLTFNKADGVCVRIEPHQDGMAHAITLDKYTVNPTPPIQDSLFFYKPKDTTKVKDGTDEMIKGLKNSTGAH